MKNKTGLAATKAALIFALLILFLTTFITCEDRDWKNPCDAKTTLSPSEWAPTNLQTEQLSVSQIKLTWQQTEHEIDGFRIDRKIGTNNWIDFIATFDEKTKQYIDTNAVPLEKNTYRIYAYTGKNNSAPIEKSLTLSFPQPSNFQIQQLSISELKLTWQDNIKPAGINCVIHPAYAIFGCLK